MEPTPSREEVERAIKSLKDSTAARPDGIPSELLKLGGDSVTSALHRIIIKVWQTGNWPEDWTQSTFVPLFKKGDPTVCANYRTISLISHASKVLAGDPSEMRRRHSAHCKGSKGNYLAESARNVR